MKKATVEGLRSARKTREVYIDQLDSTVTVRTISQGQAKAGLELSEETGDPGATDVLAYWLRVGLEDPVLNNGDARAIVEEASIAVLNQILEAIFDLNRITPAGTPEASAVEAAEASFPDTAAGDSEEAKPD